MNGTGSNKDLEELIASMSIGERKVIKAGLSEQRTQLYDLYLRKLPYEKILAAMAPLSPQGVAQVKSQLTDTLIRELARYRIGQRKGKASQYVWEATLLSEVGLHANLLKRMDAYIKAAEKEEDHFEMLRLLGLKRDALVRTGLSRENQKLFMETIYKERRQLRLVNQLIERQSIHAQALPWRHRPLFEENTEAVELRDQLLCMGPGDSVLARLYYYRALLILIRFGKDRKLFEQTVYKVLKEIEAEPSIKENPDLIKTKVIAWYNIGLLAIERKDFDRAVKVSLQMSVWRNDPNYASLAEMEFEERHWVLTLLMVHEGMSTQETGKILEEMPHFQWKSSGVKTTLQLMTAFYAGVVSFYEKEYRRSLGWLEVVVNLQNPNVYRPVVCQTARMMALMAHYSLGNYDLLESMTLSTKRHLKKHGTWNDYYRHALTTILRLANAYTQTEAKILINASLMESKGLAGLFPKGESARHSVYEKWLQNTLLTLNLG